MLARLFEVRETRGKGKGLFSRELMPKGTAVFIECLACSKITKTGFQLLPEDDKNFILKYGYAKADGSYLVPCDEIIYLNHSCKANTLDSGHGFDIVVRDIAKGEEATYDYRLFHDSDDLSFQCLCRENVCCGTVRCVHPPLEELARFWSRRVDSALKCISNVSQPLGKKLPI
jgi:SET domain-containing protein